MRNQLNRFALVATLSSLAACMQPYQGRPQPMPRGRGYVIWHDGARWHLHAKPARHLHRFHGFITTQTSDYNAPTLRGGEAPVTLRASNDVWREGSQQTAAGVSFDVTTDRPGGISWTGRYAGFDIAIDGVYERERIHLGSDATVPDRVPFSCDPH